MTQNAYWTYLDPYIEREWQILRAAWDNQILSEGYRVTPFCPSCQTSLSAGEVALGGYENLEDPSMYFKMKIRGEERLFLVAWTTMPFHRDYRRTRGDKTRFRLLLRESESFGQYAAGNLDCGR